ncbi:MAG: hypothetical protein ACN6O3_03565 [Comamonas sp.]
MKTALRHGAAALALCAAAGLLWRAFEGWLAPAALLRVVDAFAWCG